MKFVQPNPTHTRVKIWTQDPTQPTTHSIPYKQQQTFWYKKDNFRHTMSHLRDLPWPSTSTTLVASMNSARIKKFNFLCFCCFGPTTQPNPPKIKKKLDPTQSNPTQPVGWPNPWTTLTIILLTCKMLYKRSLPGWLQTYLLSTLLKLSFFLSDLNNNFLKYTTLLSLFSFTF